MNWIEVNEGQWINLNDVFHIWIDETVNGFYIMGELKHNTEEVVLSLVFKTFDECYHYINELLKK